MLWSVWSDLQMWLPGNRTWRKLPSVLSAILQGFVLHNPNRRDDCFLEVQIANCFRVLRHSCNKHHVSRTVIAALNNMIPESVFAGETFVDELSWEKKVKRKEQNRLLKSGFNIWFPVFWFNVVVCIWVVHGKKRFWVVGVFFFFFFWFWKTRFLAEMCQKGVEFFIPGRFLLNWQTQKRKADRLYTRTWPHGAYDLLAWVEPDQG